MNHRGTETQRDALTDKVSGIHTGLLLNFRTPVLKQGIKRLVL